MPKSAKEDKKTRISPTSLNLFLDCPCCFWLKINKKISRPSGPMSTLPRGVDETLKLYFDKWRGQADAPPLLQGKLPGKIIADQKLMDKLRSSKFGFDHSENIWFGGKLDDALMLDDGAIVPIDNKTYGFAFKDTHASYINQMGSYTLMLHKNNIKTRNLAYLIYYYFDHKSANLEKPLDFNVHVKEVKTDPDRIEGVLVKAEECLKGPMPELNPACSFCKYRGISL